MSARMRNIIEHDHPVSAKRREQAATARLVAQLHAGRNGAHLCELSTRGMLGTVMLSRQNAAEAMKALAVFMERAEQLDDGPDLMFSRPPEKLVF